MKNLLFISQGIIEILVGLGAVAGGAVLILAPSGSTMQLPPDMLKGTLFGDFLVPGIILFLVNGVGQLAGGILSLRKSRFAGYAGAVLGFGLIIWIFVQVSMIGGGHILQYSYFTVGVIETALSFLIQAELSATRGHNPTSGGC